LRRPLAATHDGGLSALTMAGGELVVRPVEPPRRVLPLLLVGLGVGAVVVTLPFGVKATVGGSLVLLVATAVALGETRARFVTWANALAALFLVFWLIPMKSYGLPVNLPFALEPYRLFLLALFLIWIAALVVGKGRLSAAGHGGPILFLFLVALASMILNLNKIADLAGSQTDALKPMSFFIGFLFVYMLVASTTQGLPAIDRLVRTLVVGGSIVAVAAIYESARRYNVFDHLDQWIPVLVKTEREVDAVRGGRLRVYASAQHPIALGCALTMMVPLAVYLAQHARSKWATYGWLGATILLATGAFATISRTIVVMGIVMILMWLMLRRRQIQRFWPLVFMLPVVVHFVAPGALGGIWKAFFPEGGLVSSAGGRAGETGSGRFADYGAARMLWEQSPLVGNGSGYQGLIPVEAGRRIAEGQQAVTTASNLIFDNAYLTALVELGILGVIGLVWLGFGAAFKLGRAAKKTDGPAGDLMAVCAVSCAGFAASMYLFDAIAFVQATLVFVVIAALGMCARQAVLQEARDEARALEGYRPPPAPSPLRSRLN
jgi:hypothetical protein